MLSLATFMSSLDLFVANLAFPSIAHDYRGASLGSLSWILNGYTVVFAAVLVPAGRFADRIGRKRMFVAGLRRSGVASGRGAAQVADPLVERGPEVVGPAG